MPAPYIYVDGDRTKTPVNIQDQEAGAALVLVTAGGRDIHFTRGLVKVNDPAKIKERFDKGNAKLVSEG